MKFWVVIDSRNKNDIKEIENCIYQLFSMVNVKSISRNKKGYTSLYYLDYDLSPCKPDGNNFKIFDFEFVALTGWVKNLVTNKIYSSLYNSFFSKIDIENCIVGEFSLCILTNNHIYIATDYYCTHPVYSYIDESRTIYTSDLRILLMINFIKYELNHDAIKFSLSKDFCINESTLTNNETYFLSINKIPENTLIEINRTTNEIAMKFPFINLKIDRELEKKSLDEVVLLFKNILNTCVEDRVDAGVNGLMLSGGIDSSSILGALVDSGLEKNILNYTICFPDKSLVLSQDKFLVEEAVKDLNLAHEFISLNQDLRFLKNDDYLYFVDGPQPDANPLGLILIGKRAQGNGCKMMFTGEGGDVVLGEATEDYLIDLILKKEGIKYAYQYIKRMGSDSFINRMIMVLASVHPKLSFYTVKYYEDTSRDINIGYLNDETINSSKHIIGDFKTTKNVLKAIRFSSAYNYYIYTHLYPRPAYLASNNSLFLCSHPLLDSRILSFAFSINPLHNVNYHESNLNSAYENSKILARLAFREVLPEYLINKKRKTLYALMSRKMFKNSIKYIYQQASNEMYLEKYGYIDREKYLDHVIGYILQVRDENFDLGLYYQYIRCTYEAELWTSRFAVSKKDVIELVKYRPLLDGNKRD